MPLFWTTFAHNSAIMPTIPISPKRGLWWHSSKIGQKSDKMTDHRDYM